jgi:hypothetical protein
VDIRVPIEYEFGVLVDLDSVHRRISSGDSQGTGRLQYGRRQRRDGTTTEELRGAGLRVTATRVALLETVRDGDHLGVEAIASGASDRVGHISLQVLGEALHALTAAGLVRRLEPTGSQGRFEGRAVLSLTSTERSARPPA